MSERFICKIFSSLSAAALLLHLGCAANAQSIKPADVSDLQHELENLKAEQARLNARISFIESMIGALREDVGTGQTPLADLSQATAENLAAPLTAAATEQPTPAHPLELSGDFRLRYETNFGAKSARDRNRGVFRSRLRARYALGNHIKIGAELVTGDGDDPNTADVTIGDFVNDVQINLSQLYASLSLGKADIFGGKFPQVFHRTDLVWDGDVNPQGAALTYQLTNNDAGVVTATAIYFLIDEAPAGADSAMLGGELAYGANLDEWRLELSGSYYDYRLRTLQGADSGDLRSNLLTPDGTYLSDFNLIDVIASVSYQGFGDRWPVRFTGDFVKNLGAANSADTGYSGEVSVGTVGRVGQWRLSYGYLQSEADAVLAAFSHDNFAIATNYKAHQIALEYRPAEHVLLNATLYSYRPLDPAYAGVLRPDDWLQRLRLNMSFDY